MAGTARRRAPRVDSRRNDVLDAAAALFGERGYRSTTVREISAAVDMLPGSVYCHFASKEELLMAVYEKGAGRISRQIDLALAQTRGGPWRRLEVACRAHLEMILTQDSYALVIVRVLPTDAPAVAARLIELRDDYERRFVDLIAALGLPRHANPAYVLRMLLGAMNASQTWFREGGDPPEVIAARFVAQLRRPLDTSG